MGRSVEHQGLEAPSYIGNLGGTHGTGCDGVHPIIDKDIPGIISVNNPVLRKI